MQLPDSSHVLGDFDDASFQHFGDTYRFIRTPEEEDGSAKETISVIARKDTLSVKWAFGHDPLQQVLLPGQRGRLQALTVAWDVKAQKWYSLYPDEPTPAGDVLDWQHDRLSWNYMCAACHTTGLERGYELATDSYETTWAESTVGCEACHGPGSQHLESPDAPFRMAGTTAGSESLVPISGRESMAVLDAEMTMCAACHWRRTPLVEPTVHGESFLDQYAPSLISDGLYYDDGQILDEVYVYGSFLQSGMAQAGVTCSDCHDSHSGERRLPGDALCQSCHAGKVEDVPVHQAHETGEAQISCETCHMPERTYMGVDNRGDHRFGIPDPVSARSAGSRNVCADCHGNDRTIESILGQPDSRPAIALAAIRALTTDRDAIVREVLSDTTVSRIQKGSLIQRLGMDPSTDALRIVMTALSSGDPFERVGALRAIADPAFRAPLPNLTDRFADSLRWIRVEAVATALAHGYDQFEAEPAKSALADYLTAQLAVAEQPEAHLNLASMYEVTGEWSAADASFQDAARLASDRPDVLTGHGLMLGRWANRILGSPAQGENSDAVYKEIRERGEGQLRRAVSLEGTGASQTLLILGLYLGEQRERLADAASALDASWELDPTNRQARYNAAVSHHQMGDLRVAEERYRSGMSMHPQDLAFKEGLMALLMQEDRWQEASVLNQQMRREVPGETRYLERQAMIESQLRSAARTN
jgi:Tfp pilus assembly protein PilF